MAGKGFAPKPDDQRARGLRGVSPMEMLTIEPTPQPELPSFDIQITKDGHMITQEFSWPDRTREWWAMWGASKLAEKFTDNDWSELLDTAFIHAKFWSGDMKLAGELRLRAAKFGATPEDRARLRIQFATADEIEERAAGRGNGDQGSSRGRYQPPKAV